MKTRALALLAALAAMLTLQSCLESHQTLNLKKDGSGTLVEETMMGAQMVGMMEMAAAQGGENGLAQMYAEEQYKKKAASYGEGVEYVKLEKVERNGGKGVKVTYKFADVNKVLLEPGSGLDSMGPDPGAAPAVEKKPLKFAYADGKLTVTFPDPPEGEGADAVPEDLEEDPQTAQMMQLFKDLKVSAKIVVEPGIASTNATHREGDTITLMAVDFGEILQNPEGAKILQKLDMEDRAAMEEALKGIKGVQFETKPSIEVKVK